MKELFNEDLSRYTTVRIGGIADRMLIPESTPELIDAVNAYAPKFFVGGGSNLLINNRHFDLVVCLKSFDNSIENLGNGEYRVGASVYLPKLINAINGDGYGGIEYLCNVPGLIGGAVVMNAGSGKRTNRFISDYIVTVTALKDGKPVEMSREECAFSYRNSIFRETPGLIVTSVLFRFPQVSREACEAAKSEKINYYKTKQDPSHPNFGSVFRQSNHRIMVVAKKLKIGKKVHFSGKTANWIINENHGTFQEAIQAIEKVERLHRLLGKQCSREVIVWE